MNKLYESVLSCHASRHPGNTHNGEFARISQEKDGSVIEDPIPIALVGVEFDREATRIASAVCGTLLAADGREARNAFRPLPSLRQHVN